MARCATKNSAQGEGHVESVVLGLLVCGTNVHAGAIVQTYIFYWFQTCLFISLRKIYTKYTSSSCSW